jgi:hypothetical protein
MKKNYRTGIKKKKKNEKVNIYFCSSIDAVMQYWRKVATNTEATVGFGKFGRMDAKRNGQNSGLALRQFQGF